MNDFIKDMLMDRLKRPADNSYPNKRYGKGNNDRDDFDDFNDFEEKDSRRGVKGTGPYSRRRMDRGNMLLLTKSDIVSWKERLLNADGTRGPHFGHKEIVNAAEHMNISFDEFTDKELCMAANMIYSDFCEALSSFIPPDKEVHAYVKLAEAFLDDEDGPEPSEKTCNVLSLYS